MTDRLLLVEDDPRIRGALMLGLADEGYQVAEAGSGESALRLLDAEDDPSDPRLVLTVRGVGYRIGG